MLLFTWSSLTSKLNSQIVQLVQNTVKPNDHIWVTTTILRSRFKLLLISDLWTTTTCQQRPLFLGPKGGRCKQNWLWLQTDDSHNKLTLGHSRSLTSYLDWEAHPVVTTATTTGLPISEVEFPSVAICSQGVVPDILIAAMIKFYNDYRYIAWPRQQKNYWYTLI